MSFASMQHFYSGSWITENVSQAYSLAPTIIFALEQGNLKEYKCMNSSSVIYANNGLRMKTSGVDVGIPTARAQYIIGQDLATSLQKGKNIKAEVDKILGK